VPALSLSFIFAFLFYPLHLDFELNSEPSDFDQYQTLRKRTRKGQHNPPPVFFSPSTSASNKNYLFGEIEVDCIISDMFYVWSVDVADKLGIPRIVFFSFW